MATKIRDIQQTITGQQLKDSANEGYFPVDITDGLTYNITRTELVDFIIKRGQQAGLIGAIVNKGVGYHSGRVMVNGTNIYEGSILTCGGGKIQPLLPNSAFNKNFSDAVGTNGTTQVVARADHTHTELTAISLQDNAHIAVFQTTNVTSYTITEQMLKDKMRYSPVKDISPVIGYTVYHIVDPNMVDVTTDVTETIEYQGGTGTTIAPSGHVMKRFKQLVISGLSTSKSYAIKVNFTDNGGIAVIAGASS